MVLLLDGNSEIGAHVIKEQSLLFALFNASDKIESSHKSNFLPQKRLFYACATCSELPSNISINANYILIGANP